MSADKLAPLVIDGWTVFAHPLLLAQIAALAQQVEALKQRDPAGYVKKNPTKRLAVITRLAFDVIARVALLATIISTGSGRNSSSSTACSSATTHRAR